MAEKRKISLGLNTPTNLEDAVIYVNFSPSGEQVCANAFSTTPFKYTSGSLAGNLLREEKITGSTYTGDYSRSWERPYKEFLQELVDLNNGEIDYFRLIEESVSKDKWIKRITEVFKDFNNIVK